MPLFEYHCPACGQDFEKIVRFSEADRIPVCPNCGAQETRKKISAAASFSSSSSGSSYSGSCGASGGFT